MNNLNLIDSAARYKKAFEDNLVKVAAHYKVPKTEVENYAIEKVVNMQGYPIPIEYYKNLYSVSLDLLADLNQ